MSIVVENATKRFGEFLALNDVSLEVPDGSLTALLGPSGSGKSTLLRLIAGLEEPDAGRILISGRDATAVAVHENVAFGLRIRKQPKGHIDKRVHELLSLVHLDGLSGRFPSQLSGGQRQRMALARALAVEPKVLLLDEPFGALDAQVRKELRAWLRRLHDEVHVTTVFVTHDQEEAMEVAEQIVVMNDGQIEQAGAPRELYEHPANKFVMGFVGAVNRLGSLFVRPHDVEILHRPETGTEEAMIEHIVHLGFEVRVELVLGDGDGLWAQITRADAQALELEKGQIVYIRPNRARVFDEDGSGPTTEELQAA